jgi:hypothetical protein
MTNYSNVARQSILKHFELRARDSNEHSELKYAKIAIISNPNDKKTNPKT